MAFVKESLMVGTQRKFKLSDGTATVTLLSMVVRLYSNTTDAHIILVNDVAQQEFTRMTKNRGKDFFRHFQIQRS